MKPNRFIEKFESKSDKELDRIMNSTDKDFVEEARLAAIFLLEKRNGKSTVTENAQKIIEENKEQERIALEKSKIETEKRIQESKEKNHLTNDPNAPELHSKRVITVFSAIFSTIFGVVLLMYNMKHTNNPKGRIQVLVFGILWTLASILTINYIGLKVNFAIIFNLVGAGILTEYFWNKFIGKAFEYRKRSWIKPAIISVIITIPFVLAIIYGG